MPTKSPELTVLILNYNSQFWLKQTLSSLTEYWLSETKYRIKVWVVDNHSQDDSVAMLRQDFPQVKVICSPDNVGFAAGNNLALKEITSKYVFLLNNDVELNRHSQFDQLIAYLENHSRVGMITPRIELPAGQLDQACHRGEPTPWASFCYYTGLEKIFAGQKLFGGYHLTHLNLTEVHPVEAISGAAMLIRTAALKQVGLFDERFFMYAEDLDLCHRFRAAKWQIVYYPLVKIIHHKYKSGLKTNSNLTAAKTKNYFYNTILQYYDKHYRAQYPRLIRFLIRVFIFIKKGGWS